MSGAQTAFAQRGPRESLPVSRPFDPAEREADRAADAVVNGGTVAGWSFSAPPPAPGDARGGLGASRPTPLPRRTGVPLDITTRRFMAPRFGYDFATVRIHTDSASGDAARALGAEAYTSGSDISFAPGHYEPSSPAGARLIAHELAHVVQQTRPPGRPPALQRKVFVAGVEMTAKQRAAFLTARKWANKARAASILEDMAAAGDPFDFTDEAELTSEIVKRSSTVGGMLESQRKVTTPAGAVLTGFGYPFSSPAELYGPRVNYAARDLWQPAPPDNYARRTDKAKNARLLARPRGQRHEVYGDLSGLYWWILTDKGKADPYSAITLLSVPQQHPHRRSLLHCDYLISIVEFKALADAIGKTEFVKRIKAFGPERIVLRWDAFTDLYPVVKRALVGGPKPATVATPGLRSLQAVRPTTTSDLVVGDHAVFSNHLAYDVVNQNVGNAWRLENAILIRRQPKGPDVFLGHGSDYKTEAQMRDKLKEEFNDVARQAIALTKKAASKDKKVASAASAELTKRFPGVKQVSGVWRLTGPAGLCKGKMVDEPLREIRAADVPGLKDPCDPTKLHVVWRPLESAKGKP